MAKSSDAMPWVITLLVTGGFLYRPLTDPRSQNTGSGSVAARDSSASSDEPKSSKAGPDEGKPGSADPEHKDAIDIVSAHFGIDMSAEPLGSRAREAARVLMKQPKSGPASAAQRKWMLDVLKLPSNVPPVNDVTASRLDELLANPLLQPQALGARADATPFLKPDDARSFLRSYLWRERDELRLELLREAMKKEGVALRCIVATVPDPIDSNVRWMFDPMVDALQRATADSDYVLDRFYVPDWKPQRNADVTTDRASVHERWPGVVLFRHATDPQLLLVFLVSETATSGIHQQALLRALAYKSMLDTRDDVDILGPSFSGSVDSMVHSLHAFVADHPHARIRIVSGGATRWPIRFEIEKSVPQATFRATVLTDQMLFEGVAQHLLTLDPTLGHGRRLAVLQEANTAYGHGLLEIPWAPNINGAMGPTGLGQTASGADADNTADDSGTLDLSEWLGALYPTSTTSSPSAAKRVIDTALQLPFPIHISRLRADSQAERASGAQNPSVPQRFRSLNFDDPGTPTDQMPSFSPKLTSGSVELILASILDTLKREHITTVGLFATDTRDKLFLARQIAKALPAVTLFTIESDLLFVHPDYNGYARGMIVASSYPLFVQNQAWTGRKGERRLRQQFSMTNAQGVYNATLALLHYDVNGQLRRDVNGQPPLSAPVPLDYRPPAPRSCYDKGCIPPVWISVVAQDALWPIGYAWSLNQTATVSDPLNHTTLAPEPASQVQLIDQRPARTRAVIRPSGGMTATLIMFSSVCLVTALCYGRWRTLGPKWRRRPELPGFDRGARAVVYQRLALTTLLIVGALAAFIAILGITITAWSLSLVDHLVYSYTVIAVAAVGVAALHSWAVRDERGHSPITSPVARGLRVAIYATACVVVTFGCLFLARYLWIFRAARTAPVTFTRYAERALQAGGGVSPLIPVLLLGVPIYCWALLQLWRVGGPRLRAVIAAKWIDRLMNEPTGKWRLELRRLLSTTTGGLPPWILWTLFVGFLFTAGFVLHLNVVTIEPFTFSWFLVCCWVLTQLFIALSLARSWYAWLLIRRLLAGLNASRLSDAFARLPKDVVALHSRFSTTSPARADLLRPARHRQALANALHALTADGATAGLPGVSVMQMQRDLDVVVPTDLAAIQYRPWSDTSAFWVMIRSAARLMNWIELSWMQPDTTTFLERGREIDAKNQMRQWLFRAEEYIAMLLALVLRELLSRVTIGLVFVTVALLFVVAALSSFPIHPWQPLIAFVWLWMLVAAITGVVVSVQMERDPVVSRLSGTSPNKVTWNLPFVLKLVVYGVVPVLTLFATQFPEFGGSLLRWVTPIQPLP